MGRAILSSSNFHISKPTTIFIIQDYIMVAAMTLKSAFFALDQYLGVKRESVKLNTGQHLPNVISPESNKISKYMEFAMCNETSED